MQTKAHTRIRDHEVPCPVPKAAREPFQEGILEGVLEELASVLFTSLPRSDQRRKGLEYVQGLLGAEGRKSIRNISSLFGGEAAEQSLHHFISGSTWDWDPVRRALARHLEKLSPARAYVLRPMVIPKAGDNSVGVDRHFFRSRGQTMNAQQAMGVWAASDEHSTPVNWRLHLPETWLEDETRRRQAAIPETLLPETLDQAGVAAYLDIVRDWGLPVRPVVMDAREADVADTVRRLRTAGAPMLLRVAPDLRLSAVDLSMPYTGGGTEMTAHQLMLVARPLCQPVILRYPGSTADAVYTGLTATVQVRLPQHAVRRPTRSRELLLLGVGENGGRWPAELWLTDIADLHPAHLLRLTRLVHRVDRDFTRIAERVGIRDFSGRSYSGWHRHVTLASAAHAIAMLSGAAGSVGEVARAS
ncbi:transposase [Streptomyces sp. RY43-2]|uniref:Transposase n=1 Tax=Streptomyces macrolidinus TaxID=2952607 RepID=A0ABT0ZIE6_9ACTN|nr:transposase [Streptomyces macrolidinus]MCN9243336.1 transposase [Streptomyces macrolidinus]